MADLSRASTKRTSQWSESGKEPVWFGLIVAIASFALAGCNTNQGVNASSQTTSEVFAGHYLDNNPYNPISYAQNNTGRGGR
jgi:hypothetical protein